MPKKADQEPTATEEPTYVYRFRGGRRGAFLQGVPQRHLTAEDVEALEPAVRAELEAHVAADLPATARAYAEAADPVVPGETDSDQVVAGQSPDPDVPPVLPGGVQEVPVTGESNVQPGAVQSDRLA